MNKNKHNEMIIDQFTRQAEPFAQSTGHTNEESLALLIKLAEVTRSDDVLDIACGTGMVACAFAAVAGQVTGIDITPAMLDQARLLAERRGLTNVTWREGDIERLPFPDRSFSLVVSRYAFHHFLNPAAVLAEMVRVCRPGGRVLIADGCPLPDKAAGYNRFEKLLDPSHTRALTLDEFRGLMTGAGLSNIRVENYRMEMELERQLTASFPNEGDAEEIRRMLREDLGVDRLGINAHLRDGEIHFAYPVAVIVADRV